MRIRTPRGSFYTFEMTGLEGVMRNLNREINKIEKIAKSRLIKAALLIRREAQKKCPIDTGNLRASAYTIVSGDSNPLAGEGAKFKGDDAGSVESRHKAAIRERVAAINAARNILVEVGFTAYYAVFVHEIQAAHNPPTQWKYLENAIKENRSKIIAILRGKA